MVAAARIINTLDMNAHMRDAVGVNALNTPALAAS